MNFKRISFWGSIASIIVLVIILYLNAKENNDEKTLTTQGDNVSTVANYNGTVTIVNPEFPIGISKNMSYLEARKILLKNGWQPIVMNTLPNRHPVCWNHTYGDDNCIYFEVRACSDTVVDTVRCGFIVIKEDI